MVRRFYIAGGNNENDPAVDTDTVIDQFFDGKTVSGLFKQGDRYLEPFSEFVQTGTTVRVTNGAKWGNGEVIIIEVSPLKTGTTCEGPSDGDVDDEYYFPDLIKCVFARVNSYFESRDTDSFSVHYDRGLYNQVGNDRLKNKSGFLMGWLQFPFDEGSPRDSSYSSDVTCRIILAMNTKAEYTQDQREDINFFPRLIPVYKRLIYELSSDPNLEFDGEVLPHDHKLLPYWGGGDVAAPGQPNIWKQYADCIDIPNIRLKKQKLIYCKPYSNF